MSTNHHVILRSRIEVTIDKHSQNSLLQHTIHKVIQQRIMPVLFKLFSQYVPSDVVIHLDKLVIDGGSLSTLSKQLPHQIEQILMLKLKEQIGKAIHNPALVMPLPDAKRQAIVHYLSEGNFAWWMTERSEKQIEKIYLELLHHTPLLIEQLWYNLNKKEKAVQRCMALFSRTTVEHTLACLLKQPIEYFRPILAETGLLLHQTKILTNLLYTKPLLSMALLGIVNQQRVAVDRMSFLSMLLKQVALQTSTNYENILEKLHTYYAQNEKKSSCNQTTKSLVLQLRDLVITPPKFWYHDLKDQEKVLKELDKIGHTTMAFYQLSATMRDIKIAMNKTGIRPLVKSWLQEASNREKLVKHLPDELFMAFLASIDPSIVPIFSDVKQIVSATTADIGPDFAIKANTLAYCAFEYSKTLYLEGIGSLCRQYIANNIIGKPRLATLLATQSYNPAIKAIVIPLVSAAPSDIPETMQDDINHQPMKQPTILQSSLAQPIPPCAADILCNQLSDMATQAGYPHLAESLTPSNNIDEAAHIAKDYAAAEPDEALPTKHPIAHLDRDSKNPLSDVVDFLVDNELPKNQSVPAYFIAKCLQRATPKQIRDHLAPLCQEATILKKLIQHATDVVLSKLFQAFIPYPNQMLDELEKVILRVLQRTQQQINIRLIKEIFITAAISHTPLAKQYIMHILFHLSTQTGSSPTILCDQLIDTAKQSTVSHLVETFTLIKEKLTPLNLNKIDEVDLMFLSTHEILNQVPLAYSKLLPAIKDMVRQSVELSQAVIAQLVAQHLPSIPKPLAKTISIALYKQIADVVQSKTKRIAERWHLFLHTGKLGNYSDATALLNDVVAHLPTFSLSEHKTHVRQRLIANFTHTQLMLLVRRHCDGGKTLVTFIEGSYQLWCATQGALGGQNITKNLFWDSVLKTLPKASTDDWLAQITTELSNVLEITPTTLLATFRLLDTKGIPEALTTSLNRLQEKYQKRIYQQAIQRGYKEPILTKLYVLLNGNLSFFAQQYHLAVPRLGDELVQFMEDRPFALTKLLEAQENHPLAARRMVHYFSQAVTIKIIAYLAKDHVPFVMHYLDLLSNPLRHATIPPTWQKELYISTIYYLITKKPFEERTFVHHTLLTTCYPKEVISKIIASIVATKATNQTESKMITLLKPWTKPSNQSQPALANHPEVPAPKVNILEEEVRVYTKNTGLVFLWPFFYDFFKVHHLMVGNQFCSDQAAHNAVYLLQYLVTGKLKSPEWQLTLPKLLCGLSYDEVLLPYRPIDKRCDTYGQEEEEEMVAESAQQPQQASEKKETDTRIANSAMEVIAANSQVLIEKVIKRWKSLTKVQEIDLYKDFSIENILKSYFLNRLGILTRQVTDDTTKSKFWHLTIMHQDHDTSNLLPPWSMTNVKLPWMQEKIILFWIPG